GRPLQSSEIAARQAIPEQYLDQLLTTLRRAGLIRSVRGPQGGHALLRRPEEIRASEVVIAMEGSLDPIACLEPGSPCTLQGGCAQRSMWEDVRAAILGVLDATTIADLRDRALAPTATRYVI
ncbi:MAG TPA: Rrf2 family transcriptional regulator, partial [Dehalococcoidia bacterium]|nr:Rrf2 family transcriptional regulator [Dehalococcoidia bacterium]